MQQMPSPISRPTSNRKGHMLKYLYKKYKKARDNEDGSDIVTFVMIIPLFFFVFAMMMTFSQIIYAGTVALNAAHAGCRQAIVQVNKNDASHKAMEVVDRYVNDSGMGVKLRSVEIKPEGSWSRGNICNCVVEVEVDTAIPMNTAYGRLEKTYVVRKVCPMMIERK